MSERRHVLASLIAMLTLSGAATAQDASRRTHDRLLVLDSHIDLPDADPTRILTGGSQFDLDQARQGGLDVAVLALFVPSDDPTPQNLARARAALEAKWSAVERLAAGNPQAVAIARTPEEAQAAVAAGRLAVVPSFLNAYPFGEDLAEIDRWASRGVAVFGLVHAGHNAFADSSRPAWPRGEKPVRHGGLSATGKAAVARLNDLGILVDVSQLSGAALRDALGATRVPVVASHSSVASLVPAPRNLSDAELDAIKANGGVVQVNAFSAYVRRDTPEATRALAALAREFGVRPGVGNAALPADRRAEYTRRYYAIRGREPKATLAQFVDHIDYAVKRIGVDHVGISSDFNHGGGVTGWSTTAEAPAVTAELLRRGHSEQDVAKLWGGNFLRVWAAARAGARPATASR